MRGPSVDSTGTPCTQAPEKIIPTHILGISAFHRGAAAALLRDGEVVAAAQEERFSRTKAEAGFPTSAVADCLRQTGIDAAQVEYMGFFEKPMLRLDRLMETYISFAPRGFGSFTRAIPEWLQQKLELHRQLNKGLARELKNRLVYTDHHEAHAASAFLPSPYETAAVLTMDAAGEWATATLGKGEGGRVTVSKELRFPHSPGLLYSAFTDYCGFRAHVDEDKLMDLAACGDPEYADRILEKLISLRPDGSFQIDPSYFDYCHGRGLTTARFHQLFGGPPREPDSPVTAREANLAASVQRVLEEILLRTAQQLHADTGASKLCLAGGVAQNAVAAGRLLREGPFEDIWIQPAASDAGGALGVALLIWHQLLGHARKLSPRATAGLLGPAYSDDDIRVALDDAGADYQVMDDPADELAQLLADGKVVGLFAGRMELGSRAAGSRCILADPRRGEIREIINQKVKFREDFRPFGMAVLREHAASCVDLGPGRESPAGTIVAPIAAAMHPAEAPSGRGLDSVGAARSELAAVTHVDGTTRVQTVSAEHGLLHRVLQAFHGKTGCPALLSTGLSASWEPIARTPQDAYRVFMASDLDALCAGSMLLRKPAAAPLEPGTIRLPVHLRENLLNCPRCGHAPLDLADEVLSCSECQQRYPFDDGIPQLFWPHEETHGKDLTDIVKGFYEDAPFPNYNDHDTVASLVEKARSREYGEALDRTIPYDCDVIEVGCGTGQLSNFLAVANRRVVGADLCMNSLRLAENFRRKQHLSRVSFVQMNLFRPSFSPGSFDVVLCNGVLLTTLDPEAGFASIARLVKPGGHIVIGLYNRYGRFFTNVRRVIFRITGGRGQWLDPYLRSFKLDPEKRRAWYRDQYEHPHETQHSFGDVLRWFDRYGIEFVRGIPNPIPFEPPLADNLFEASRPGTAIDHFMVQSAELCRGSQEGGFFVMIGRRPPDARVPERPVQAVGAGS